LLLPALLLLLLLGCNRTTSVPAPASEEQVSESPAAQQPVEAQAGAPAGDGLAPGDTARTLTFDGIERQYILHVPSGHDAARPTPLVLAFHGLSLDGSEMQRISQLNEQADASGFFVAYPNGTGKTASWNGGHCCSDAAINRVDDVGFVRALIAEISALANIDTKRIYATGFSNGAIFVYRLACQLSDQIAAVGPIGATQVSDDQEACPAGRAIPIIHFHGTADRMNAYEGGTVASGLEFVSVPQAIAYWVERNGCDAAPQVTETGSIVHAVYAACAQNATVELYTITDGEHAWPGGEAVSAQVGEPTMEISATPLMWEFFAAHPLP
jgi:polyhydroxybutyrate depolymerase